MASVTNRFYYLKASPKGSSIKMFPTLSKTNSRFFKLHIILCIEFKSPSNLSYSSPPILTISYHISSFNLKKITNQKLIFTFYISFCLPRNKNSTHLSFNPNKLGLTKKKISWNFPETVFHQTKNIVIWQYHFQLLIHVKTHNLSIPPLNLTISQQEKNARIKLYRICNHHIQLSHWKVKPFPIPNWDTQNPILFQSLKVCITNFIKKVLNKQIPENQSRNTIIINNKNKHHK